MNALPKTHTEKLYLCATRMQFSEKKYELTLLPFDPTKSNNACGYILVGSAEVTVDVPECDLIQAEVAELERARDQVLADAQLKANQLNQKIQQLLCIEHQVQP